MAAQKKAKADVVTTTDAIEQEVSAGVTTSANDTVVVCLNRPLGVIFKLKSGKEVVIEGHNAHLRGYDVIGNLNTGGGFSLNIIPRADWEEIYATYHDTALFKHGRIFASDSREDALAEAKEKADTRHGLEPSKGIQSEKAKKG